MVGQHVDFLFLTVRVKVIAEEREEVRDVFPVEVLLDGLEKIIELGQQTPVLLIEVGVSRLPLWVPFEPAHATSPNLTVLQRSKSPCLKHKNESRVIIKQAGKLQGGSRSVIRIDPWPGKVPLPLQPRCAWDLEGPPSSLECPQVCRLPGHRGTGAPGPFPELNRGLISKPFTGGG